MNNCHFWFILLIPSQVEDIKLEVNTIIWKVFISKTLFQALCLALEMMVVIQGGLKLLLDFCFLSYLVEVWHWVLVENESWAYFSDCLRALSLSLVTSRSRSMMSYLQEESFPRMQWLAYVMRQKFIWYPTTILEHTEITVFRDGKKKKFSALTHFLD